VRATVVTGMPSWTVRSSGSSLAVWARIVLRLRLSRGAVTSNFDEGEPIPQWAAAERWLSTASGPQARTAAIRWP